MMDHDRAAGLLGNFVDGTLSNQVEAEIEQHIEGCPKCTEWLAWYPELKSALLIDSGHPSSEDLALFAVRSQDMAEDDRLGVEEHLQECSECRDLVSRSRSALENPSVVTPFRRSLRQVRRWALPVAAGLVLGVFGGRELGKTASGGGVVPFRVIGPAVRGSQDLPEIALSSGKDSVLLAVDVPRLQGLAPNDLVEIILANDRRNTVWETEIEVEEIRRASADGRMFLIAIPSGVLHQGRFVIQVLLSGGTERIEFPIFFSDS